jgi:asparagine synthase (glutamine-hydrolysing)
MGEKPLYFGWQGEGGPGASCSARNWPPCGHPSFEGGIDRRAIVQLMRHGYVGEDLTIHRGAEPGAARRDRRDLLGNPTPRERLYWDGRRAIAETTPRQRHDARGRDRRVRGCCSWAVGRQMMSDVPLGAFLSGGVDSSAIVGPDGASVRPARAHVFHRLPRETLQRGGIRQGDRGHLGTDHTELYVGDTELRDVVPQLPQLWDEPFADSSQIPTYLVAKLAREHVTVALSGDGGDELLCGYDRYRQGAALRGASAVPAPDLGARRLAARMVQSVPKALMGP